jgi:hypothetical protein
VAWGKNSWPAGLDDVAGQEGPQRNAGANGPMQLATQGSAVECHAAMTIKGALKKGCP